MFDSSSSSSSESEEEVIRRRKIFRPRININFATFYEHNERFRISAETLETLLAEITPNIQHASGRSGALNPKQQLCIALHWLGTGTQFHAVGDMHGISKASVCRSIHRVVNAIIETKFDTVIKWPANIPAIIEGFHSIAGFPHICGVVDGTLINIDAPSRNEADFVDRKGNHSINCMFVCGPDLSFYYVSANWPGSVHGARVLRNSTLCRRMENGWRPFEDGIILGDSAYPLKPWLIPPLYRDPTNEAEVNFNRRHKSTGRIIENALGVFKEKKILRNYLPLSKSKFYIYISTNLTFITKQMKYPSSLPFFTCKVC